MARIPNSENTEAVLPEPGTPEAAHWDALRDEEQGFVYLIRWFAMLKVKGRGRGKGWQRFCPDGDPRVEKTGRDWSWQLDLAELLTIYLLTFVLKARQVGLTYIICALAVWTAITEPDQTIIIIANKMGTARGLVKRCIRVYKELPQWLKDASPIVNEAVSGFRFLNGSEIIPLSSKSDTGRSESASLVLIDETAFVEALTDVFSAAEACADGGGRVVMVTTAKGVENLTYDWAVEGVGGKIIGKIRGTDLDGDEENQPVYLSDMDMVFTFLPWWFDPKRDTAWYERKQRNYKKSLAEFNQEYPGSWQDAFITSGLNYFDVPSLREHAEVAETYRDVAIVGTFKTLDEGRHQYAFVPDPHGHVTLWADLMELETRMYTRRPFVIGADCAGDQPWGDFNAASAVQQPLNPNTNEYTLPESRATQLFTIHGYMTADEYATNLAKLGWFLGTALIVPEANGVGVAVIGSLRRMRYPRIFMREPAVDRILNNLGSSKRQSENAFGFYSTAASKNQICGLTESAQRLNALEIRDPDTVSEMMKFVHLGNSRIGAREPNHDDRPDGLCLAYGHLHKARSWRGVKALDRLRSDPWNSAGIFDDILSGRNRKRAKLGSEQPGRR